ncbi:hypothetical protein NBH19_25345 [Rhizobium sp. S95]|uniref:Uncharacterized protein n=1 Tax=Ciceribacter sichuanensis TaxID=2949647 RepID=A0AAJ1C139_9HYPH|nr:MULTISPECIES: hypothetical protein [unclassified Ciceribacter]MCM2399416.1 hypothetical protein [Ciceribacter sp. S95]MCO5959792.1 hypothetical protein [Ciceribacter sp. S101]
MVGRKPSPDRLLDVDLLKFAGFRNCKKGKTKALFVLQPCASRMVFRNIKDLALRSLNHVNELAVIFLSKALPCGAGLVEFCPVGLKHFVESTGALG